MYSYIIHFCFPGDRSSLQNDENFEVSNEPEELADSAGGSHIYLSSPNPSLDGTPIIENFNQISCNIEEIEGEGMSEEQESEKSLDYESRTTRPYSQTDINFPLLKQPLESIEAHGRSVSEIVYSPNNNYSKEIIKRIERLQVKYY